MSIRLIQGDCITEMQKLIKDEVKVDMVLTDVPYGTTACKWDNIIPFDEMWDCLDNITYENTPILLFGSEPFSSALRMSNIKNFKYDCVWYKNTTSGFPFAKYQPLRNHEMISVFYKKRPYYNPIKEERDLNEASKKRYEYKFDGAYDTEVYGLTAQKNGRLMENKRYPTTIKRFKTVPNSKGRLHPTQKPTDLLEYLIKTYTKEEDIVLDFTMGSGSTGVACKELNRNFIGIELEKEYYEIAKSRLNDAQTKLI